MISIICPFTDREIMEENLIASLKEQDYNDYEIIALQNKELGLKSASEVLNYGARVSKGDILLFSHQDVRLLDCGILRKIEDFSQKYEYGIAGAAGVSAVRGIFSKMVHGRKKEWAGQLIEKEMIVDTCDECFFFIKKDNFREFDDIGSTWHFYAVEYCLRCQLREEKVFVVPLNIHHLSLGGSLNRSYWKTLRFVAKKYKHRVETIPTTMGIYRNDSWLPLYIFLIKWRQRIRRDIYAK